MPAPRNLWNQNHAIDISELAFPLGLQHQESRNTIAEAWRDRLHEYLGGTVKGLGGVAQGVGGVSDHVHLLIGLRATHCLADFMRELKKSSSAWVHDEIGYKPFAWQEGYAAFTVSATARSRVQRYIANQERHHHKKTFREELIELLRIAEIPFDEKYLD